LTHLKKHKILSLFNSFFKSIEMKKIILSLLCIASLSACSDAPKTPAAPTAPPTPTVAETPAAPSAATPPAPPTVAAPNAVAQTTCYALRFKKDLDAIQLTITGDDVTGLYAVEPHEKDGAHGSIKGKKTGDQITGIFLYMIEGSIQSEEVMFKMSGDKLLKANGELVDKGGVLMLKDKAKVKWEESYATTDCAKVSKAIDNAKDMVAMIAKAKK
jgi:hypothetical protein